MSQSMSTTKASPKSQLYLDDLEIGVTGFMIVMVCRIWDVNATPGRYLSTDFVIYDSKGNIMHVTAQTNVAHNFLKLKEGGIYYVKNFLVHPNKDEFRILMNASFIVEFDGETSVRKAFVKSDGFIRYPFELVELENLEVTNNKYLIDVIKYVTNVGRTIQQRSGTRTLDFANSSTSSTMIIDDDGIPALKQMKTDQSQSMSTTKASPKSQMYLDDLEIGVTGFMIVMACRIWDVNATLGRTVQQRSGTMTLDFCLADSRTVQQRSGTMPLDFCLADSSSRDSQ
nr:hypothetical protein [Tanacetum cinerariifolium]